MSADSSLRSGKATSRELASRISALFLDDPPESSSSSACSAATVVPTPGKSVDGSHIHGSGTRSTPKTGSEDDEPAVKPRAEQEGVEVIQLKSHESKEEKKDGKPLAPQVKDDKVITDPGDVKIGSETKTTTTAQPAETVNSLPETSPEAPKRPLPPHLAAVKDPSRISSRDVTRHEENIGQSNHRFQRPYDTAMVTIPLVVFRQLQHKAQLYDRLIAPSPPTANPISTEPAAKSNLPPEKTLTIKGLPRTLRLADMIHSVNAPGGVRYIRVIEEPHGESNTAVVTFCSVASAEAYAKYVSQHGFFTSKRVSEETETNPGETLLGIQLGGQAHGGQGGIKRFWVLKTHIPGVELVLPSNAPDGMCDDEKVNDIEGQVDAGIPRSVRFKAEAREVAKELEMFSEGTAVVVEGLSYFMSQKDGQITVVRFGGIGDAVVVRRYFELRKGWEGKVDPSRDVCDKPVDSLGWEGLNKLEDGKPAAWVGGIANRSNLIELSATAGARSDLIDMASRRGDA